MSEIQGLKLFDVINIGTNSVKNTRKERDAFKKERSAFPHLGCPLRRAAPEAGATHRTAKIESVGSRAGSNDEREKKERVTISSVLARTQGPVCVCAPRGTGVCREGQRRQLLSPGGLLPHYPSPPRA
ncbi:unnamed protein product [Pieris brassicae]|uniref:Uncharacterized protein n=1 Tax=Pieris brassicae TaxID=7116 RepID=A0A9P0TYE8_PIEBR|nr:unnamed protein product [Pieris brassicae]